MKILLVDDDSFVLEGLKSMLNWDSFDGNLVGEASNGDEGLKMALANHPDVIISDIVMPVMDGLEMSRLISQQLQGIHIFLLSGHDEFEYAQKAIQYGVQNYILKPVNRSKIIQLEQNLIKINNSKQYKQVLYKNILNTTKANEILYALKVGNNEYFNELFHSKLFYEMIKSEDVVNVCMWMINLLYDFLEKMNIENQVIQSSKQHIIEEILALQNGNAKIEVVSQKYFDVIQNVNIVKNTNTESLIILAKQIASKSFMKPFFNIAYLANQINVSVPYLSTLFKNSEGINISVYITSLRIEHAKEMLRNPSNSVADIASSIGYADQHYFAKLFKKNTSYTPTEFRNLFIRGNSSSLTI